MNWPTGMRRRCSTASTTCAPTIARCRSQRRTGAGDELSIARASTIRRSKLHTGETRPRACASNGASRWRPTPRSTCDAFRSGDLTPVFFGSALAISACAQLLDGAGRLCARRRGRNPRGRPRSTRARRGSPASSSRSRPIWTPITATASPSCAFARASFARGMKLTQYALGQGHGGP